MRKKHTRKPGAGRPKMDEAERKEKVVRVRLTNEDLTLLTKLHGVSNHKSMSDLIRRILYKEPVLIRIEETGLEHTSNVLYWLGEDLQKLIKSKKATAEAFKEKAAEIQHQLLLVGQEVDRSKYHNLLMDSIGKS